MPSKAQCSVVKDTFTSSSCVINSAERWRASRGVHASGGTVRQRPFKHALPSIVSAYCCPAAAACGFGQCGLVFFERAAGTEHCAYHKRAHAAQPAGQRSRLDCSCAIRIRLFGSLLSWHRFVQPRILKRVSVNHHANVHGRQHNALQALGVLIICKTHASPSEAQPACCRKEDILRKHDRTSNPCAPKPLLLPRRAAGLPLRARDNRALRHAR